MGVIAVAVGHLIAAGVTGDALVTAIAAMEAEAAPPARSSAAIRQERYRRNKASQNHNTVTVEAAPETPSEPLKVEVLPPEPTVTGRNGVTLGGTIGGESSFLPSKDSGKKDLEIQHAREPDEVETLAAEWNVLADELGLSKVQHLTEARRKAARKRLQEAGGMAGIREIAFPNIRASAGLQGKAGGRKWKANFDWLLQQSSFTKLMEGGYDHWQKPKSDLMEAADRLRERLGEKHRQDAQGGGTAGLFDRADGTGNLPDDHSFY